MKIILQYIITLSTRLVTPQGANWGEGEPVMWAVTDMDAVPPGAMLINPQVS